MISMQLAQELKEAGLVWRMNIHDFFAIPDRNMDGSLFVLSDMMAYMDLIKGWPVVSFHGTSEWALDYILSNEVVWMPTESQLRQELLRLLARRTKSRLSRSVLRRSLSQLFSNPIITTVTAMLSTSVYRFVQ